MAVSKVVLGNETLIDLTGDSVSSENLLQGATAHAANGEQITGGVVVTPMYTGTKAAIEEAIALGQIPEDAVVNITDDEETSSFQTQINEINSSLENVDKLNTSLISATGTHTVKNMSNYKMLILCLVSGNTSDTWELPNMMPYKYFKTRNSADKYVYISLYSGNNPPSVMFHYVSDTQISVTSLTENRGFNIYGVK